jgi:hypothetical protein
MAGHATRFLTKEKARCWTRQMAFAQVRQGQISSYFCTL